MDLVNRANDKRQTRTYVSCTLYTRPSFSSFSRGRHIFQPHERRERNSQGVGWVYLNNDPLVGRGVLGVFFLNKKERDLLETVAVYQATTNDVFYAFYEFFIFVFIPRYTSYSDSNEVFNKL